jgi:hypothetical protein
MAWLVGSTYPFYILPLIVYVKTRNNASTFCPDFAEHYINNIPCFLAN